MGDQHHIRLDDDTSVWANLIARVDNLSMAKFVNRCIRFYVNALSPERKQFYETHEGDETSEVLEPPKAKRKRG